MPPLAMTELERAVLLKLTEGDHPLLRLLRRQVEACTVTGREMTGVGFYLQLSVPEDVERLAGVRPHFPLDDVSADLPGLAKGDAGFMLWIVNGAADCLEGYTFEGPWPAQTEGFTLSYLHAEPQGESTVCFTPADGRDVDLVVTEMQVPQQ
jgi:hypothetical protein